LGLCGRAAGVSPDGQARRVIGCTGARRPWAKVTDMSKTSVAKFNIGQVVRHKLFQFRGVVFDIDPEFASTEERYQSIPVDTRPRKDQPFYHLLAENAETQYIAYVSEQNLLPDLSDEPVRHPKINNMFERDEMGNYRWRNTMLN
jgi:heat shock protein HspQ